MSFVKKVLVCVVAISFAVSVLTATMLAADPVPASTPAGDSSKTVKTAKATPPVFAWATKAASVKGSTDGVAPSVKYNHRIEIYLKSVVLTAEQKTAIEKIEKSAAADIDNPVSHKAAVSALHVTVIASLTPEQQAQLKMVHSRVSKSDKTASKGTTGVKASGTNTTAKGGEIE